MLRLLALLGIVASVAFAVNCAGTVESPPLVNGGTDAGPADSGSLDAGTRDAGPRDAGLQDSGTDDAGTDAGADGGIADAGGPDSGASPTCWPFDQPPLETLRASQKKVFAHYFSAYPLSLDNKDAGTDYYTKNYLSPSGESGKWSFCGGLLRERPLPQTPWATGVDYEEKNMETEVRRAAAIGLDGFTYDVLNPNVGSIHRTRLDKLLQAANAVDPGFVVLLVPDMTVSAFGGGGGTDADALTGLQTLLSAEASKPAVLRLADGRIVLAPFAAERRSAAFWTDAMTQLSQAGYPVALVPMPVGSWSSNAPKFSGVTLYGASSWGTRTVSGAASLRTAPAYAHDAGLLWMGPVSPQDSRPKNLSYTEADNSAAFRAQWEATIDGGADWVQLITWNDYSEDTEISPSSRTHTAFYDLAAFYTAWFKEGTQPPIVRDALYAFYRAHSMDPSIAPPDLSKQDGGMRLVNGPTVSTNQIELVGLLTAPGTLEVSIGGQTFEQTVDAGIQRFTVPLVEGTPTFRLLRGGVPVITLNGSTAIDNTITYQDPLYHADAQPTCTPYFP